MNVTVKKAGYIKIILLYVLYVKKNIFCLQLCFYEIMMIVIAVIKLAVDIIRLHRENKNSRPDTWKD